MTDKTDTSGTNSGHVREMSATECLRALLDERGVEWIGTDFTEPTHGHPTNTSLDTEHHDAVFVEYVDGTALRLFDLTPEQAVEATLGRGTCRFINEDNYNETEGCDSCSWFRCSACGWMFDECDRWLTTMSYCPNCGKEVEP